ncbi:MAG TPA: hypothetical protein VEY51_04585, partial [Chondromyces sp.]|nr:hypothetical protein [Chondromyces sp.]
MNHDHPAFVLDFSANGVGIIRSLARKGITVHAYDTEKPYKVGKSRLAHSGICPSPLTNQEELLSFLINEAKKFDKKPVLYTGSDDYVLFLSAYRDELAKHFLFLLPDHSLIENVLDKKKSYELAVKHGIPTPTTYFVDNEEQLEEAASNLDFPCILKPVYGHEFRKKLNKKAFLIHDKAQLIREYPFYREFGELIIQEIIPGDN